MKGIDPSSKSDGELIAEAINNLAKSIDGLAGKLTYDSYELTLATVIRDAFMSKGGSESLGESVSDISRNGMKVWVENLG